MKKNTNVKTTHLGQRKVGKMNHSKIVTLPKAFADIYLDDSNIVDVTLSEGKLTLTPAKVDKSPQ